MKIKNLSIIIPVFNEEENVAKLSDSLLKVLPGLNLEDWEILFVDDGSTDKTFDVLRDLKKMMWKTPPILK